MVNHLASVTAHIQGITVHAGPRPTSDPPGRPGVV